LRTRSFCVTDQPAQRRPQVAELAVHAAHQTRVGVVLEELLLRRLKQL
jgi:hypothetical protein